MATQETITPIHVNQAIARIRKKGVPANAQSTRYDLVDPATGERFPPKLVLSIASELSGTPLSRKDFSGGDQTNPRLEALGFQIVGKSERLVRSIAIADLVVGEELTNEELGATFAVGNSGGMRFSSTHNCLVLVADHTKGLYDDRWDEDILIYTGMGRLGPQALTGQNLRLAQQAQTQMPVHLFEVFEKYAYKYMGLVALAGPPGQDQQVDDNGVLRSVHTFPLRLLSASAQALPAAGSVDAMIAQRRKAVRNKSLQELLALATKTQTAKPGRRNVVTPQFQRSEAVSELSKRLAKGKCGLCDKDAPFVAAGVPYLECHHVHRLADGGADTIANTIALCPNCHRQMHLLAAPSDVAKLRNRILERLATVGITGSD